MGLFPSSLGRNPETFTPTGPPVLVTGAAEDVSPYVSQDRIDLRQDVDEARIGDGVIDELSTPLSADQPAVLQAGEVSRGVRLGQAGDGHHLGDAPRPSVKGLQDREARWIGETSEELRFEGYMSGFHINI
jgi:hypothetical protein